jgi:uncharacterized membrane protein
MPNNTNVLNTEPQAMIESLNFLKLNWEGNMSNVSFQYSFLNENLEDLIELEIQETNNSLDTFKIGFGLFVLTGSIIFLYFKRTKLKKLENKQNIMRTLPTNENKIVEVLLKRKYGMKRSKLEKITKIAKSSLSSSLKNLERKNIIEIDKTYTSHYIRFTKWFNDL